MNLLAQGGSQRHRCRLTRPAVVELNGARRQPHHVCRAGGAPGWQCALHPPPSVCTADGPPPPTLCSCQLSQSEMSPMWHSQHGLYVRFTHALCKCCVHGVTDITSECLYCAGDRTVGFKTKKRLRAAAGEDTTHAASTSTPAGQCALTLPRCTVSLHAVHRHALSIPSTAGDGLIHTLSRPSSSTRPCAGGEGSSATDGP